MTSKILKTILSTSFVALWTPLAIAGPPHLVKDLDAHTYGGQNIVFGENGQVVFFAQETRLYRTDGTFEGTYGLAADIGYLAPGDGAMVNGKLVLCTQKGLLASDGTQAGTRDLGVQPCSIRLVRFQGELYFPVSDPGGTWGLWKTDGTTGGTRPAAVSGFPFAALPGALLLGMGADLFAWDGTSTEPTNLGTHQLLEPVTAGNRVFFFKEGFGGAQLWSTDGSSAGTTFVVNLPFGVRLTPSLTALGNRVLFAWPSGGTYVPWVSDGTAQGTKPLASTPLYGAWPFSVRGFAYFVSSGKLWRTDGTVAGTSTLHEEIALSDFAVSPSRLLLREADGSLFTSDGTSAGLVHLGEYPAFVTLHQSAVADLGGRTFFANASPDHGPEIWATDGTPTGTAVVRTLNESTTSSGLDLIVSGPGRALLSTVSKGSFATDGTEGGTQPLTYLGAPLGTSRSLFWIGDTGYACGDRLWRTTGPGNETLPISPSTGSCRWAAAAGSTIFFTLWNPAASILSLWTSDGSPGGTSHVKDLGSSMETTGGTPLGGRMLFTYDEVALGSEPWVSDGTPAGTHLLKDVNPGFGDGITGLPVVAGAWAYFRPDTPYEIWRTDGTSAGTTRVLPGLYGPTILGVLGDRLLLAAATSDLWTSGIWSTDGTPAGTQMIEDLTQEPSNNVRSAAVSGGRLFYSTRRGWVAPATLRMTDGTPGGSILLAAGVFAEKLTAVPGGVAFAGTPTSAVTEPPIFGDNAFPKSEPWFSDGTAAGTRLVGRINSGPFGSMPTSFAGLGSMVLFAAEEHIHGRELWRFDPGATGGSFYTLEPCRLADTRMPEHEPGLHISFLRDFQIAGRCGVPVDAKAVALNVTLTRSNGPAYVELFPHGHVSTGTRSTSVDTGQTRASSMMLGLEPASRGQAIMRLFEAGTADVILDVSGYFR